MKIKQTAKRFGVAALAMALCLSNIDISSALAAESLTVSSGDLKTIGNEQDSLLDNTENENIEENSKEQEQTEEINTEDTEINNDSANEITDEFESDEIDTDFDVDTDSNQTVSGGDVEVEVEEANEAAEGELTYQTITKSVENNEISISGNMPEGVEIEVTKVVNLGDIESQIEAALDSPDSNVIVYEAFDIKIIDAEGNKYQPVDFNETVNVNITNVNSSEENNNLIMHISDDGSIDQVAGSVNNNTAEFTAYSFSVYAITTVEYGVIPLENYTVTFEPDNGENTIIQTAQDDGKLTLPAEPSKDGYKFAGWYKRNYDGTWGDVWNFEEDTIDGNGMILYAKWYLIVTVADSLNSNNQVITKDIIIDDTFNEYSNEYATAFFQDSTGLFVLYESKQDALSSGYIFDISKLPWVYDYKGTYNLNIRQNTKSIKINNNITELKAGVLSSTWYGTNRGFEGLEEDDLVLPENLVHVGRYAFESTKLNSSIYLPQTLQHIENYAFNSCNLQGELYFPDSVQDIGEYSFYNNPGITKISGGKNVQYLYIENDTKNSKAFYVSNYIETEFDFPEDSIMNDYNFVLDNRKKESLVITVADSLTDNGDDTYKVNTADITIDDSFEEACGGKAYFRASDGLLVVVESGVYYNYEKQSEVKTIKFKSDLTEIGVFSPGNYEDTVLYENLDCQLILPETVTKIDKNAFYGIKGIKGKLVIHNSVTLIDQCAFYECTGLDSLVLGQGVQTIEDWAFKSCTNMKGSLIIPNSTTNIARYSFVECSGLESLTLGDNVQTIGDSAFYDCSGLKGSLVIPNNVISIGNMAFNSCSGFDGITLGNSVQTIGNDAFSKCSGLTGELFIPDTVTFIGYRAFNNCPKINKISGGDNVITLNNYPKTELKRIFYVEEYVKTEFDFTNPIMIEYDWYEDNRAKDTIKITVADSLDEDGNIVPKIYEIDEEEGDQILDARNGFEAYLYRDGKTLLVKSMPASGSYTPIWSSLKEQIETVKFRIDLEAISDSAFDQYTNLKGQIIVPDTVTSISSRAFYGCTNITSIYLGKALQSIGDSAFKNDSGLTGTLKLPDNLQIINNDAFSGCSGLTELILSENLQTIGNNAFRECSGFTKGLVIKSNVTTIGSDAFYRCEGFESLTFETNVLTEIGDNAFRYCSGMKGSLRIPDSVSKIGTAAFMGDTGFNGTLTLPQNNPEFKTLNASTFSGDSGFTGSLVIPKSVTIINQNCFLDCYGFNGTLTFEESSQLKTIGTNAFTNCHGFIGDLQIPDSVSKITGSSTGGDGAFKDCYGFNGTLTLPNNSEFIEIEGGVFLNCSSLIAIKEIPSSVTKIGRYAFKNCSSIESPLNIPSSIIEIASQAFYYCDKITEISGGEGITNLLDDAFMASKFVYTKVDSTNPKLTYGEYDASIGNYKWKNSRRLGYKVEFDVNGAQTEAPETQLIEADKYATEPEENPVRKNYTFKGWYLDDSQTQTQTRSIIASTPFNFTSTKITSDITLKALYTCTISFDASGADTPNPPDQEVDEGGKIDKPSDPEREGYEFKGWYPEDSEGEVSDEPWDFEEDEVDMNTKLVAKWNVRIHFDIKDGISDSPIADQVIEENTLATDPNITITKLHYTFIGWYLDGQQFNFSTPVTKSITLEATYQEDPKFEVSFDTAGGEPTPDNQTIYINEKVQEPKNPPTKPNLTFGGWFNKETGQKWNFAEDEVTQTTKLVAKWLCTITFDNEGETHSTEEVEEGELIPEPQEDPSRKDDDDAIFLGWYEDDDSEEPWDFDSDTPDSNITLHARYGYEVTYNVNGGTPEVSSEIVEDGKYANKPSPDPSKEKLTFIGWYTEDNQEWNFTTDKVTHKMTLKAIYRARITFNPNNGTDEPTVKDADDDGNVDPPENPTRPGFEFGGWRPRGKTEIWDPEDPIDENTELTAVWMVRIKYDVNGGTPSLPDELVEEGELIPHPATVTKSNLTLKGWFTSDGTEWQFNTTPATQAMTLKAKWVGTVTFHPNNGEGDTTQEIEEGNTITPPEQPTRPGFEFGGWIPKGKTDPWNFEEDEITEDTELTARWYIRVKFDSNGSTTTYEDQLVEENEHVVNPGSPTRDNLKFKGWYNGDSEWNFNDDIVTEAIILKAIYTGKITFNPGNGDPETSQDVEEGELLEEPEEPTRPGFEFGGWRPRGKNKKWNFDEDVVEEDTVLEACWNVRVSFNTNGGNPSNYEDQLVEEGTYATNPGSPTKTDLTFFGWYTDGGNGKKWNFETDKVTEAITLTAIYKAGITWDPNNGDEPTVEELDEGGTVTPPEDPTKPDLEFGGWYKDGSDEPFNPEEETVDKNIKLTAKWFARIRFDTNGGNPSSIPEQRIEEGKLVSDPGAVSRTNFEFAGWYNKADNTKWNFNSDVASQSITLIAKWKVKITYKVDDKETEQDANVGEPLEEPEEPKREDDDSIFLGWYPENSDGNPEDNPWDFDDPIEENTTLVAKFGYEVSFDTNGAKQTIKSQIIEENKNATKPNVQLERGFDIFLGWKKITNGVLDEDYFDFDNTQITGKTILQAQFKEVQTFEITFDTGDSDSGPIDSQEVPEGGHITKPNDPTRKGFKFKGWKRKGSDEYWDFDNNTVTDDVELVADWEVDNTPESTPIPTPDNKDEESEPTPTPDDSDNKPEPTPTPEDNNTPKTTPTSSPNNNDNTPEPSSTPDDKNDNTPEPENSPEPTITPESKPIIDEDEDFYIGPQDDDSENMKDILGRWMEALKTVAIIFSISLLAILGILGLLLLILLWIRRVKVQNDKNTDEYKEQEFETVYKTTVDCEGSRIAQLFRKNDRVWQLTIPQDIIEERVTDDFKVLLKKFFCKRYHGEQLIIILDNEDETQIKELGFVIDKEETEIQFNYAQTE